jgi:hypothetical protein
MDDIQKVIESLEAVEKTDLHYCYICGSKTAADSFIRKSKIYVHQYCLQSAGMIETNR